MAFVADGSQAFLSGDDDDDNDNLAALDSMTTSGMNNNQSAFMSQQHSGGMTAAPTNTNSGGGGELGESLFDRIRRRTEEQQRQQKEQQQQQRTTAAAQSAFVSQQPSAESSMELGLEREPSDGIIPTAPPPSTANTGKNAFDTAVQSVENRNNNNNTTENTYSFTATTGEDFSFQPTPPSVPTYGPSRNDPAYYSGANSSQQYPASFQEKAAMALNDAGSTIQSLLGRGMAGASSLVTSAQERLSGGSGGRGGYNNNFLLREDSLEQGIGNSNVMQQPPPPPASSQAEGVADSNVGSGQAYSMVSYAKTFCEDLYGFFMQLPPLGKAGVVVVLLALWLLMRG
ncbi:hypothetical protein ACHAWT_004094 [Skeletonema menzelii]